MKEITEKYKEALETLEVALKGNTDPVVKNAFYLITNLLGTDDVFEKRQFEIAKAVKNHLKEHNVEIPEFFITYLKYYNELNKHSVNLEKLIDEIIKKLDEHCINNYGTKPFTVFGLVKTESNSMLIRASRVYLFIDDLKNAKIEDLQKQVRGCGKIYAQRLKDLVETL